MCNLLPIDDDGEYAHSFELKVQAGNLEILRKFRVLFYQLVKIGGITISGGQAKSPMPLLLLNNICPPPLSWPSYGLTNILNMNVLMY